MPMMSYLVCALGPCANDVIPQSMVSFHSRMCNRAPITLSPLKRLGQPRLGDLRDGLDRSGDGSQQVQSLVMGHVLLESRGFSRLRAPKGEDRSRGFPRSCAFPRSRARVVSIASHVPCSHGHVLEWRT